MWKIESGTPIKLAVIEINNINVTKEKTAYNNLVECATEYAAKFKDMNIGEVDRVKNARQLFRSKVWIPLNIDLHQKLYCEEH